jgi:hypothetical protein
LKRPRKGKSARALGVLPVPTLDQIVHFLVGQNAFVHWPLSDLLHLKNTRQRIRDSDGVGIALQAEAPTMYRADLFARIGVRGLETSGCGAAMSDSDALNVMDPELVLMCAGEGQHEGARHILPWALRQMSVRSEGV